MMLEARNFDLTRAQKNYIKENGAKIPQPRPIQLYLQEKQVPDGAVWADTLGEKPFVHISRYGEFVMPWDHDPSCLEPYEPKEYYCEPFQKDYQSNFLVGKDGEITMPRPVNRDNFGPGDAGQRAFKAMMFGEGCERIINMENMERCGKEPTEVLDFDVAADLEQILICGKECRILAMEEIQNDLMQQGRSTYFGINGWGRA